MQSQFIANTCQFLLAQFTQKDTTLPQMSRGCPMMHYIARFKLAKVVFELRHILDNCFRHLEVFKVIHIGRMQSVH